MINLRTLPLRIKLIIIQVLTALVVLLLTGVYFVYNDVQLIKSYKTDNLKSITQVMGMNSASALLFNDKQSAEKTLLYFAIQSDITNAAIFDSTGKEFASYTKNGESKYVFSNVPVQEESISLGSFLYLYSPIIQDKKLGTICVRVELLQQEKIIKHVILASIIVILIGTLLALALSLYLQKIISTPILQLYSIMERVISTHDFSIRVPKVLEGKDEIGTLAVTSNELMKQVEKSQKDLEKRIRDLDEFTYIVSHDLKAPLRGISTLSEFIIQDYADKLDADGKEQLIHLQSRVIIMNELIDNILRYSREGRKGGDKTDINVNELVKELIDFLSPPAHVKITIENELPLHLFAIKTSVQQVFQNLISNAIKFIDKPQGEIKIGCTENNDEFWKFYVSDNGPGIEQKHFSRIFQLFQTLSSESRDSTGIGLAIVKKIIEDNGAEVSLKSEVGKGTTFYFTWPKN